MNDEFYMAKALKLAERGIGKTSPNPMVGALIVKNNKIIAEGWHHAYGELHAERDALKNCKDDTKEATMYVTLEPCCHHGKQPPCVEAIVEAGITRVVIGSKDPNPLVAGKGVEYLRQHNIQVTEEVLMDECDELNEIFLHYIKNKQPYVVMKYAMTMDGKIASFTGNSKWVSSEESRIHVQSLRNKYRAIMVGVGTVLADDPMLNCRVIGGRNPIRIVCDSNLQTSLQSKLVITAKEIPTVIACCKKEGHEEYEKAGCHVFYCKGKDGKVDLNFLIKKLGESGIDSILIEGGGTLNWSMLQQRLVNKVYCYIAPKLIGGSFAKTPIEGQGFSKMEEAIKLVQPKMCMIGEDILLESRIV